MSVGWTKWTKALSRAQLRAEYSRAAALLTQGALGVAGMIWDGSRACRGEAISCVPWRWLPSFLEGDFNVLETTGH